MPTGRVNIREVDRFSPLVCAGSDINLSRVLKLYSSIKYRSEASEESICNHYLMGLC